MRVYVFARNTATKITFYLKLLLITLGRDNLLLTFFERFLKKEKVTCEREEIFYCNFYSPFEIMFILEMYYKNAQLLLNLTNLNKLLVL